MKDKTSSESWLAWSIDKVIYTPTSFALNLFFGDKTKISSNNLRIERKKSLSDIEHILDKINEDILLINQLLDDSNAQLQGLIKDKTEDICQKDTGLQSIHARYFIFNDSENMITLKKEKSTNSALNNMLQELMSNYPKIILDEKSTLNEINNLHRDIEEHHEKIIHIAEILFPNFYSFLNQAEKIVNDLNIYHLNQNYI